MKKIIAVLCMLSLLAAFLGGCESADPAGSREPADKEPEKDPARTYITTKVIDEKLAFVCDDKLIVTEYQAYEKRYQTTYSLDGASAVCHRDHEALLYIHDGTVEKLTDEAESCSFSTDGSAIAFLNGSGLHLYQKKTGEVVQVDTGENEVYSYALSPDGKTLVYMTMNDKISQLFVHRDGTSILRAEFDGSESNADKVRYYLISTNNSADIIYVCSDLRSVISVDGGGGKTKVGKVRELSFVENPWNSSYPFYLNADHSQLLYYDSFTYLSNQGCEGTQFKRGALYPVQPDFVQFPENRSIITCHFADLSALLMCNSINGPEKLWYPDASGTYAVLETGGIGYTQYKGYWLDPAGQYFFYHTPDLTLYRIDLKNNVQPTVLAQSAEKFAVSEDCSTFYYATPIAEEDGEGQVKYSSILYRCNGKDGSEQRKIETHQVLEMYCSEDGKLFFRAVEDGQQNLYTLTSGGEVKLLLENVKHFRQEETGLIYAVTESDDYYIVRGGKLIQLKVKTMDE